jgi:hypothetical protein
LEKAYRSRYEDFVRYLTSDVDAGTVKPAKLFDMSPLYTDGDAKRVRNAMGSTAVWPFYLLLIVVLTLAVWFTHNSTGKEDSAKLADAAQQSAASAKSSAVAAEQLTIQLRSRSITQPNTPTQDKKGKMNKNGLLQGKRNSQAGQRPGEH